LAAPAANVRLTSNQSVTGTTIINALSINGAKLSLAAGSRVTLSSGVLAIGGGNLDTQATSTSITGAGTLDFGASEAIVSTDATGDISSPALRYIIDVSIASSGQFVKSGAGTLVLTRPNALSGGVVVNAGTLVSQAQGALGSGPIDSLGTLAFELHDQSLSNQISAGYVDVASGLRVTLSANSGPSGFWKQGGGTLVLTGQINEQPDLRIFDGIVRVDGSITSAHGTVSIPGGVLAGSGTIDATVAHDAGFSAPAPGLIEPGAGSPFGLSTLTIGDLQLADISYHPLLRSNANDQIAIMRTAKLDGGALDVSFGDVPSVGEQYKIIDNLSSSPIGGTFTGLPEGALFQEGADQLQITYRGGDGNDVVLTVVSVPEPSAVGLLLLGGGMNLLRRRRRASARSSDQMSIRA